MKTPTLHDDDLSARLLTYAEQLQRPGPSIEIDDDDSIGFYLSRAHALGDTISREAIVDYLETWDNTKARCCGFRADLPLGNCSACIRDGNVILYPADASALSEHLWAIGNPTRVAIARYVARELRAGEADPRYVALAKRLLRRR